MPIEVKTCDIQIAVRELGLTRDRFTCDLLLQRLKNKMGASGWTSRIIGLPANLQAVINEFAEHPASGALHNLDSYFSTLGTSGFTAGGRRVTSKPMLYLKDQFKPSQGDIGAIGEGLAGYYLEQVEGHTFETRPLGVSPDFIFRDFNRGWKILVEAKTNLHEGRFPFKDAIALIELLAKTKLLRRGRYVGYLVHVNIKSYDNFEIERLAMEEI